MKYISETIKTFPLIHYKNFFRKAGFIWVDNLAVDKQIDAMTDAALPIEFPKVLEAIEFYQKILAVIILSIDSQLWSSHAKL